MSRRILASGFFAAILLAQALGASSPDAFAAKAAKKATSATGTKDAKAAPGAPAAAASAAGKVDDSALKPDALGARAFLEDLMVRRMTQALAATVDRAGFSLGARLDLTEVPPEDVTPEDSDTPADLLLGTLDPEELLRKYGGSDAVAYHQGFLKSYRIRQVNVSVGLKEDLGPEAKEPVEKWLKERLASEFGAAGKGEVSIIKTLVIKKPEPKTLLDWLDQFQELAGQLILAAVILLGLLIWKLMTSKSEGTGTGADAGAGAGAGGGAITAPPSMPPQSGAVEESGKKDIVADEAEALRLRREARKLSRELTALTPKLTASGELERVLRSWCQAGEDGRIKLACFAEAVGKDFGKLPIPADALLELSKIFARMPDFALKEKTATLQKAYWDILMTLNLGAESLEQPFGYLGSLNLGMVNQVLMDQNSKMKTLVALYMPNLLRENYFKSLALEAKQELLKSAALLSEISTDELRSSDGTIKGKLNQGAPKGVVSLGNPLGKIISVMSPLEEITLLQGMDGPAFEEYRRTVPSLGFLQAWPDDKLSLLFSRAAPDELLVLGRLRPDLAPRIIQLSPATTAEVVGDDMSRPDTMSEADKNVQLLALKERLKEMVDRGEVVLDVIFPAQPPGGQVHELKRAA